MAIGFPGHRKIIRKLDISQRGGIIGHELRVLTKLHEHKCPNVIEVICFYEEPNGNVYIIMPFFPDGDLFHRGNFDEEFHVAMMTPKGQLSLLQILLDVTRALECAHRHNIMHLDIKPDNILTLPTRRGVLTDWGLAYIIEPLPEGDDLQTGLLSSRTTMLTQSLKRRLKSAGLARNVGNKRTGTEDGIIWEDMIQMYQDMCSTENSLLPNIHFESPQELMLLLLNGHQEVDSNTAAAGDGDENTKNEHKVVGSAKRNSFTNTAVRSMPNNTRAPETGTTLYHQTRGGLYSEYLERAFLEAKQRYNSRKALFIAAAQEKKKSRGRRRRRRSSGKLSTVKANNPHPSNGGGNSLVERTLQDDVLMHLHYPTCSYDIFSTDGPLALYTRFVHGLSPIITLLTQKSPHERLTMKQLTKILQYAIIDSLTNEYRRRDIRTNTDDGSFSEETVNPISIGITNNKGPIPQQDLGISEGSEEFRLGFEEEKDPEDQYGEEQEEEEEDQEEKKADDDRKSSADDDRKSSASLDELSAPLGQACRKSHSAQCVDFEKEERETTNGEGMKGKEESVLSQEQCKVMIKEEELNVMDSGKAMKGASVENLPVGMTHDERRDEMTHDERSPRNSEANARLILGERWNELVQSLWRLNNQIIFYHRCSDGPSLTLKQTKAEEE
eukprot:g2085.t1